MKAILRSETQLPSPRLNVVAYRRDAIDMTKFTDITPAEFACSYGVSCPAIFKSEDGSRYIVQGKLVEQIKEIPAGDRLSPQYKARVEIPADLLEVAVIKSLNGTD